MVWKPAKSKCTRLALASLVVAGCRSEHELTPESAAQLNLVPPRAAPTAPAYAAPAACPAGPPAGTRGNGELAPDRSAQAATSGLRQVSFWQSNEVKELPDPTQAPVPPAADPAQDGNGALVLGLVEAIETGLAQNPDLVTLRGTENVSQAVVGVARTYPFNPTLQARILPYNQFNTGSPAATYNYVLLWQQFELCHQRRHRTHNAAALLDSVRWNVRQAELQNISVTEQAYFAILYQRGLRDLAVKTSRLNDQLLDTMQKRLQGGRAIAAEVAMVRIDTASAHQQARLAEVAYRNALLALRRQLNLPPDTPLDIRGDLEDFEWHAASGTELCQLLGQSTEFNAAMDREALATQLAAKRPDVMAARANAQAARANVSLARASKVPNLWLGPFYSRDSEAIVSVGFQTQIDIPVVNTGRPLVRQRQAELQQQLTTADQLELRARLEARTALDRYEQALALWNQTRTEGQQRPEELQQLEAEFRKGEIDILRIFQARNSMILYERTRLDSLNELGLAAAALTAASGLPPAALIALPRPVH